MREVMNMPDYKSMYYVLAAQVADAIELLIKAQQDGERMAIDEANPLDAVQPPETDRS